MSQAIDASRRGASRPLKVEELLGSVHHTGRAAVDSGKVTASQQEVLCDTLEATDPVIREKTAQLVKARGDLASLDSKQGWFARNFNDSDAVNALQGVVSSLEKELTGLRAVHGGAKVALRVDDPLLGEALPALESELGARTAETAAVAGGAHAVWEQAVAAQVQSHGRLELGASTATRSAGELALDAANHQQATSWTNRQSVTDWMSFGSSDAGVLHRAGVSQSKAGTTTASDFAKLLARSEGAMHASINTLLQAESPEYAATRANYDRVKPAHDQLGQVLQRAASATSALDSAESAIDYRNIIAAMQPPMMETVYTQHTTYDSNGNANGSYTTSSQQVSQAYQSWQVQMSSAELNAAWSAEHAKSEVRELNGEIRVLKGTLQTAGVESELGAVRSQIDWFFGATFRFGWTSYDSAQVRGIQRDIGQLQAHLVPVQAQVESLYRPLHDAVWSAIDARQEALARVELGGQAPTQAPG